MSYPERMRSLYIDDIPGTRPAKRVYDKSIHRLRHEEEIFRFARNPQEKQVNDWYSPTKKTVQPLDRIDDEFWINKRTLKKSFNQNPFYLSKSLAFDSVDLYKNNSKTIENNSSLSGIGKHSLKNERAKDPYFPHRYVSNEHAQVQRWSGNRGWVEQPAEMVNLPKTKQTYYHKWS